MSELADNAVGAILNIPPQAIKNIEKAERAIWSLHEASKKAADQVYGDFSQRMPRGIDVFINKLKEAVETMKNINGTKVDFNVNTQPLENQLNNASKTVKKTASDVSESVQVLAVQNLDFSNIKRLSETLDELGATYKQVFATIKSLKNGRANQATESVEAQSTTNMIQLLKEYIALKQKSEEQLKLKTTTADDSYLTRQKQLLSDILAIRKQINENQISGARKYQTGADTSKERRNIDELLVKLREVNTAYRKLNRTKGESLSVRGQEIAENNALRQELALLKETNSAREKLNQNIRRGQELANQAKLKSAGMGSSEDSIYQRTLTQLYKDQITVLKDIGKVRADIASEGGRASDSEREKLELLEQKYRELQKTINQTSGKYTKIDQNVQSNFVAERERQIIENAILKEQAERKYQETVAKTQQLLAGKTDLSGLLESIRKFSQEEQRMHDQLVRLQNLINQLKQERVEIKFNMNADLQAKIQPLVDRLRDLRQLTKQPLGADKLKEYYREIDILKEKIASATATAQSQAANNPALLGNQEQIDALTRRYVALSAEMSQVGIEADKLRASYMQQNDANNALDAQSQRLLVLEQRLQNINALWERLKATNQAYNADGSLTDKGKRLIAVENEVRNEIMLRRMTATEAKKYEEQKTRDAENESKKRVEQAKREAKETLDALNKQKSIAISNPQGAIDYSKNAKTVNELTDAIKNLQSVMNRTNPESDKWQKMNSALQDAGVRLKKIKDEMGEFQKQTANTSNVMSQLQGRIAAAFSMGAIMGFLRKVADVRAQFELQRVALGAIIQDRDEANKIFAHVQGMALQSPFTIMGLEKATKQIAAFGFEAKKLVPTMKMFADIAAGLGVEIDRLVLVMGHLKARNFLEGTMVRQFTNMGFNVLGELSKYYTELEGKMVSVGEVQDRVKKKMVSFEDVEEVLKRVTSAGGMFYDMQKKQSESLYGNIQRITDAYDLMLNDIGQSTEGAFKTALSGLRSLIEHWRILAPIVTAVGGMFVTAFAFKAIMSAISAIKLLNLRLAETAVKLHLVADAQKAATSISGVGALLTAITTIGFAVYGWYEEQNKLNEAMDRVRSEGIGNMYNLIAQYTQLADTVRDSNKSYEERKQALDDLHRIFKDILPDQMLEIDNIKKMTDGYKEATEAIKAYSAEKLRENLKAEAESQIGKDIATEGKDLADWMAWMADTWDLLPEKMPKETFRSMAQTMIAEVAEEVKNNTIPAERAVDVLKERMAARLKNIMPKSDLDQIFEELDKHKRWDESYWSDWVDNLEKYRDAIEGIDLGIDGIDSPELGIAKDKWEQLEIAVRKYKEAIDDVKAQKESGGIVGDLKLDENGIFTAKTTTDMGKSALDDLNNALLNVSLNTEEFGFKWRATADNINNATNSNIGQLDYFESVNKSIFLRAISNFNKFSDRFKKDKSVQNYFEGLAVSSQNINLTPLQQQISNIAKNVLTFHGLSKAAFNDFKVDSFNSFSDASKAAQGLYNDLYANILATKTQAKAFIAMGMSATAAFTAAQNTFLGGQAVADANKHLKALGDLINALGGPFKDPAGKTKKSKSSKSSSDKELKRMQDLKQRIQEVQTKYEELRKVMSTEEANKEIERLFEPVFAALGAKLSDFYKDGEYDLHALISALKILETKFKATTEDRKKFVADIKEDIADTEVEIKIKDAEDSQAQLAKSIKKLINDYQLSAELKSANLDINLALMLGGEPIKDIADLRKRLQDGLDSAGGKDNAPRETVKAYEDAFKQVDEIEAKDAKDRLKKYEKYVAAMYSKRGKIMIEYYTQYYQMEEDFQKAMDNLKKEQQKPLLDPEEYKRIGEQIQSLYWQQIEAQTRLTESYKENMSKAEWEDFKGSDVFTSMYEDLSTLSGTAIDNLIKRLEEIRKKLQSIDNVDPKAIRELTQNIEKLKDAKLDIAPYTGFKEGIKAAKKLKEEYGSVEKAQIALSNKQNDVATSTQLVSDLETIVSLTDRGMEIKGEDAEETSRLVALYKEYGDNINAGLQDAKNTLDVQKKQATALNNDIQAAKKTITAKEKLLTQQEMWHESIKKTTDAAFELMDAFGLDIDDEWKDLTNTLIDAVFQGIALQLQLQIIQAMGPGIGIAMNSALGVIGWIATGLQVVASLMSAIFKAHDKALERQIENIQDRVDGLSKAYEKLEKSIEKAVSIGDENVLEDRAIANLESQKAKYNEMINLEHKKKKTDKDKLQDYYDKLEELDEKMDEAYEKRHEKWGSTNDAWDEANNWVDAWLDAYKEAGDGLDALNESWDEFYENLVKKQATSAIVGKRMEKWVEQINEAIDRNLNSEYDYIDLFKQIGDSIKSEFTGINEGLKNIFEYAGIGNSGELILSDLQKGIQNITEPQAAAIEAYLNSMRFAVFRHTEQLDTLIATIQMQYGSGADNPIVSELKGIRSVLDSINSKFDSVIGRNGFQNGIRIIG